MLVILLIVGAVGLGVAHYTDSFPQFWDRASEQVSSADPWPGTGSDPGSGPGSGDDGDGNQYDADFVFTYNIPYYWGTVYTNWFPRPSGIPADAWNEQPYTLTSTGDAVVTSGNPPNMGWNGVQLQFTTPPPGHAIEIYLTIGGYTVLYAFKRMVKP